MRLKTKDKILKTKTSKSKNRRKALVAEILRNPEQSLAKSLANTDYSLSTQTSPNKVLSKPSFIEELDKLGVDDKALAEVAQQGLKADKTVFINSEVIDLPDHANRHRFWESMLKVKGHLNTNNQINIQANDYKLIIEDQTDKPEKP